MNELATQKLEELKAEYLKWMNYMKEEFNAEMDLPTDEHFIYWALDDLRKSFEDLNKRNALDEKKGESL